MHQFLSCGPLSSMHQFLSFGPLSSMHQFLSYDPLSSRIYRTYPNITSATHIMTLYVTKGPLRSETLIVTKVTKSPFVTKCFEMMCLIKQRMFQNLWPSKSVVGCIGQILFITPYSNMLHVHVVQAQAEVEIFLRFMLFLCPVKLNISVILQTYKSVKIPGFEMSSSTTVQY